MSVTMAHSIPSHSSCSRLMDMESLSHTGYLPDFYHPHLTDMDMVLMSSFAFCLVTASSAFSSKILRLLSVQLHGMVLEQSMWAEWERQNFWLSLKPISVTPAPCSCPLLRNLPFPLQPFFHTHSLLRSHSSDFGPLSSRSTVSSSKLKNWTDFHSVYRPICVH